MTTFHALRRSTQRPMATRPMVGRSTPKAVGTDSTLGAVKRLMTVLGWVLFFIAIQVFSWSMLICAFQAMWWHAACAGTLALATYLAAIWWPRW